MKRPELETDPSKLPGQIVNEIPKAMLSSIQRDHDEIAQTFSTAPLWDGSAVRVYGGAREGGKAVTLRDIIERIQRDEEYSPHATVNS